jgi:probable 2-oxoglutarate dehydrogenase E1 component DHKTD1
VDSVRTHGHRAARIDPLGLIERKEVVALSSDRYGLADEDKSYNVNGILWTRLVGDRKGDDEEWWTLKKIKEHLRSVYVGNVAYEVSCYLESPTSTQVIFSSCTPLREPSDCGFLTC